jgi:hypothetical protein
MNVPRSPVVGYGMAVGFLVFPLAIAIALAKLSVGRLEIDQAAPYLLFLALLALLIGLLLLGLQVRSRLRRSGRPVRSGIRYAEDMLEMLGYASFVAAEFALIFVINWPAGTAFLILAAVWALVWFPRAARGVVVRGSIDVRCTSAAAFGLVSDPNNWPLYQPQIELARPVEVPVRVGSVIRQRLLRDGVVTSEGEEEVIAFEPGKRFGTTVREAAEPSTGTYGFEEVAGGTNVEYTFRSAISVPAALLGAGLRRKDLVKRMSERRAQTMDRIKRLLEETDATSV